MKRIVLLSFLILAAGAGMVSFSNGIAGVDPVGTWTYKAPDAPEGYGAGDIVIAKEKEVLTASLKFGDYVVKGMSVKYEKDVLTFKVYLEGEYVSIKASFASNEVKGTASYSEGDIAFTAKKKAEKK